MCDGSERSQGANSEANGFAMDPARKAGRNGAQLKTPLRSIYKLVWLSLPGHASNLTPKEGIAQL